MNTSRSRYVMVAVCVAAVILGTIAFLYGPSPASAPTSTSDTRSLVFIRPAANEVLTRREPYTVVWQGTHPNTLSLRLVSVEDSSGHGVVISAHVESLEAEHEQMWNISCDISPGTYRFFFEDEATGEYIFPSEEFSIQEGSMCDELNGLKAEEQTQDLKTYTSPKYGFQFTYSSDWVTTSYPSVPALQANESIGLLKKDSPHFLDIEFAAICADSNGENSFVGVKDETLYVAGKNIVLQAKSSLTGSFVNDYGDTPPPNFRINICSTTFPKYGNNRHCLLVEGTEDLDTVRDIIESLQFTKDINEWENIRSCFRG